MELKDSGKRKQFETGAVRDVSTNKGRTDLLPLSVIGKLMKDNVITFIGKFQSTGDVKWLYATLEEVMKDDKPNLILELSKHFEKGAIKYAERNWEKGIPVERYIDSGVRHYLKHLKGDIDEPHFIACLWNITCLIYTVEKLGHLVDVKKSVVDVGDVAAEGGRTNTGILTTGGVTDDK